MPIMDEVLLRPAAERSKFWEEQANVALIAAKMNRLAKNDQSDQDKKQHFALCRKQALLRAMIACEAAYRTACKEW